MARFARALLTTASLLGAIAAAAAAAAPNDTQLEGDGLHSLMVAAGKLYFGSATEINNFNDAAYEAIATNKSEFGMFTPENSMKWAATEPRKGDFVFTNADAVAKRVRGNGQLLRCHTLAWHSQLPSFVSKGSWTRDTLTAVLQAHITNVVRHFAGQCYAWDVVNEALNDDGTFRRDVFFTTLGADYLAVAFGAAAAAADPAARLYYNDFNLETVPAKAAAALGLVRSLKQQQNGTGGGVVLRIDGVGFQAHLTAGKTPSRSALAATLRRFTGLGVEVALTELDVAVAVPAGSDSAAAPALRRQADDYVAAVGACLDVDGCVGVTVWQFTDRYSWVPGTFPGKGEACLWTADYARKQAYEALVGLLRGKIAEVEAAGGNGSATTSAAAAGPSEGTAKSAASAALGSGTAAVMVLGALVWSVASAVLGGL